MTFTCADQGGSGVASCTAPVTKTAEGEHTVTGTATDGAGNSATDSASVRIDKTAPDDHRDRQRHQERRRLVQGRRHRHLHRQRRRCPASSGTPAERRPRRGREPERQRHRHRRRRQQRQRRRHRHQRRQDRPGPDRHLLRRLAHRRRHRRPGPAPTRCPARPASPPTPRSTGEGDNLSSTASCTDVAGNTVTKTVTGIKIDRTDADHHGQRRRPDWRRLVRRRRPGHADRHDNLSGVAATYYTVDGGAAQTYDGAFSFGTEGTHTIAFWSKDGAGNVETAGAPLTAEDRQDRPDHHGDQPDLAGQRLVRDQRHPGRVRRRPTPAPASRRPTTRSTAGPGRPTASRSPRTCPPARTPSPTGAWTSPATRRPTRRPTPSQVKVDTDRPDHHRQPHPGGEQLRLEQHRRRRDLHLHRRRLRHRRDRRLRPDQTVASEGADQHVQGDAQDVAGNKSSTTVEHISIDKTAPSLVGAPTGDPNGGGWYRGDVSVAWTGDDGLSGIDPATQPANSTITGEGRNLGASARSPTRPATRAPARSRGIKIDRTAPVVTGAARPARTPPAGTAATSSSASPAPTRPWPTAPPAPAWPAARPTPCSPATAPTRASPAPPPPTWPATPAPARR